MKPAAETDLAEPLRVYLAEAGWKVRAEVNHCDFAAVRGGEELLIVEMKRALTLALVVQAARRQRITDTVYLAIPRPASTWRWRRDNRGVMHLLRRLELGLLFVTADADRPPVEAVMHPLPFTRRRRHDERRRLLEEISQRSGDYNTAGTPARKLMTAYRERAIRIAACLIVHGRLSARQLVRMGTGQETWAALYRNVYGWFVRAGKGQYELSERGRRDLERYRELRDRYLAEVRPAPAAPAPRSSRGARRGVSSSPRGARRKG